MKEVGIVICNYNKQDFVTNCIQSVLESKFTDFEIYVVDNHSTDDSVKVITEKYADQVNLIVTPENLGGSGGFNAGLRAALKAGHPYLVCLDNDVLVDENAIGELHDFLLHHPQTGMVGSKVYHMQEPDYVQQFGMKVDFSNYCVEANYLNYCEDGTMPEIVYSDAVAACSLMVRRSVLDQIGLMPEENFLYWDDTEWGYRCNLAGFKVASYGKSKVLHMMGAKKESVNTFPTYYAWRNWIRFFIKFAAEEDLEHLSETFIESVFRVVYEGIYNGESKKAETVMAAYDDALHDCMGKASEGKIFELEHNDRLEKLLAGKKKICIVSREHKDYALALADRAKEIDPDMTVLTAFEKNCDCCIYICDYIFNLEDFSRNYIYMDVEGNIFATEKDAEMIQNYQACYQAFLTSQKPVFLRQAKLLRQKPLAIQR